MKIEIKSRFSSEVLFSHECEDNSIAITLAAAINVKTDLCGADFRETDLRGVSLRGGKLCYANFRSANLQGTDLRGAYLRGANFYGANLYGVDFYKADIRGADLRGANLYGTDFCRADLYGADFRSSDLHGANLYGAYLCGANLCGVGKLTGDRPYFEVGPIGSRQDVLTAFLTEKGVFLRTGCFFGTVEKFREKLQEEHGNNDHAIEYRGALTLMEAHYNVWSATK